MKKIIILLVILTLASCQAERVVVKVTVKTLKEDVNESIVDGFLEYLEKKDYCFGGGFIHCDEDTIDKIEKGHL